MLPTSLITEVNKRKIRDMSHELKKYGKKCNLIHKTYIPS